MEVVVLWASELLATLEAIEVQERPIALSRHLMLVFKQFLGPAVDQVLFRCLVCLPKSLIPVLLAVL